MFWKRWKRFLSKQVCGICSKLLVVEATPCLLCEKRYHEKCLSDWLSLVDEDTAPTCPSCQHRVGSRSVLPQTELEADTGCL